MIRRVLRRPTAPTGMTIAGLPPGTPVQGPLAVVRIDPTQRWVQMIPADAMITADGAPVYATGPAAWDQVTAAGVP